MDRKIKSFVAAGVCAFALTMTVGTLGHRGMIDPNGFTQTGSHRATVDPNGRT